VVLPIVCFFVKKVSNGSDFTINKKLESWEVFAYDAYAFNEDYEMVEGEWTFQIWYGDEMLIEQTFETYWPDEKVSRDLSGRLKFGIKIRR
jgi:hypothetical protein